MHPPQGVRRLYPVSTLLVDAQRFKANQTALLASFAAQALLMVFSLKLKIAAVLRRHQARLRSSSGGGEHDNGAAAAAATLDAGQYERYSGGGAGLHRGCGSIFLTYCASLRRDPSVMGVIQALAEQGLGWAPTIGNVAVICAFVAGLLVNASLSGAPEAVFMLAPVLLMLSQDPLVCWGVTSRQRYVPPVLAVSGYLILASFLGIQGMLAGSEVLAALEHLALLACAAPMHALFVGHLWSYRWQRAWFVLLLVPLNALAMMLTDIEALWHLAATALLQSPVLYFSIQHIRQKAAGGAAFSRPEASKWS